MRNVWSFFKVVMQFGKLPVSLLPLRARNASSGVKHKAVGKDPPIDVPSMTTARKTTLKIGLQSVALEAEFWRNRLEDREPLSIGLFDSIILTSDGKVHFDGNAPVR